MAAADELVLALRMAGEVLVTETQQETRLAVAAGSGTERVAFSAVGDTCPLCLALDGKVFLANSDAAKRYTPPLHINCDCLWTGVGDDEVGTVDWFIPSDETDLKDAIEQHGHFVTNPDKYTELKVPAGPTGRDFTFRRGKLGERGTVEWHRPRYSLGPADVTEAGVTTAGEKWATLQLRTLQAARSAQDVQAWAELHYPQIAWALTGGDSEAVRQAVTQFHRLSSDWPEVRDFVQRVELVDLPGATIAEANGNTGAILLSERFYGDGTRSRIWFAAAEEQQLMLPGTASHAGYLTHEWGHLVYEQAATTEGYHGRMGDILGWMGDHPTAFDITLKADSEAEAWAYTFQAAHHAAAANVPAVVELRGLLDRWHKRGAR